MLHKIKQLLMGKPAPEPEINSKEDLVEEIIYMGDGTVESIYTPRSEYNAKRNQRESDLAAMLKQSQRAVRESRARQSSMKAQAPVSGSSYRSVSSPSSSRSTAYQDTHISTAAVYSSSYDSSSYDSGSSCSSSSSSCD